MGKRLFISYVFFKILGLGFFLFLFVGKATLLEILLSALFFFWILLKYSHGYFTGVGFVIDKFSFLLLVLSVWLLLLLLFIAVKYKKASFRFFKYKGVIVVIFRCVFLTFLFKDMLGFYMFFELRLIPLIFLIMGWGYQVERIQASFYLFIYTVVGSFPLLFAILFYFQVSNIVWFSLGFNIKTTEGRGVHTYIFFWVVVSFLIKLPLYGLHLWLPKAHVEAPVSGSMVLAAILLKLGAYGFYRFLFLFRLFVMWFHWLVVFLVWGALLRRFVALRQADIKSLIAYSSVGHMGIMLGGIAILSSVSLKGTLLIILGHGFCSSALFFIVNFFYERSHTRQIVLLRGQINFFLQVSYWWFLFLIVNFSAPPFITLLGESLILMQITQLRMFFATIGLFVSFFVAVFCIYLFSSISHGKISRVLGAVAENKTVYVVLYTHFFPLLVLVLKSEVLN